MVTVGPSIWPSRQAGPRAGFSDSQSTASVATSDSAAGRWSRWPKRARPHSPIESSRAPAVTRSRKSAASKVPTFREAAEKTFEANRPRWRNAKVEKNWMQQLQRYALPALGDMRIDRIGREDVLRVLTPIWAAKPETGRKVRQRIRTIMAWAQAHGYIEHNVAGDAVAGALPTMPAVKEHFRALPYEEIRAALETIEASAASMSTKLAFRFTVLTAARSGEVRGATWDEIDLDAREWRIPAGRMKAGAEHRVPLPDAALAVLEQARPLRDDSPVWSSPPRPGPAGRCPT